MNRFNFHSDPGHGWLEVNSKQIAELGIKESITGYSYISKDRKTCYLEEDLDMQIFVKALIENGTFSDYKDFNNHCSETHMEKTFIRNLDGYSPHYIH